MVLIAVYQADTLLSVRSCLYNAITTAVAPSATSTATYATIASTAMSTALRYGILETV
jgi:hypothetical protein